LNFDYSVRVQELRERLLAFMAEHIYPNEDRWQAHVRSEQRWQPAPVIEELKPKARAAGLWNLWQPKTHGGTLSNLEYAPLCEIMGRVRCSSMARLTRSAPGASRCSRAVSARHF